MMQQRIDLTKLCALVLFPVAVGVVYEALRVGYMAGDIPGPGFLPFWIGILLAASTIVLFFSRSAEKAEDDVDRRTFRLQVAAMLGLILLIQPLGIVIATAAYLAFSLKVIARHGWVMTIGAVVGVVLVTVVAFEGWLHVSLPTGPFGF